MDTISLDDKTHFRDLAEQLKKNVTLQKGDFTVEANKTGIKFYINNKEIDVSSDRIISPEIIYDDDFVIDIFKLCDNIEYYHWGEPDVCDFHKKTDSSMYGPMSRSFKRINKIILNIVYSSCCCSYSGSESYFNLLKNKNVYGSCTCFLDNSKIESILNGESCDCSEEDNYYNLSDAEKIMKDINLFIDSGSCFDEYEGDINKVIEDIIENIEEMDKKFIGRIISRYIGFEDIEFTDSSLSKLLDHIEWHYPTIIQHAEDWTESEEQAGRDFVKILKFANKMGHNLTGLDDPNTLFGIIMSLDEQVVSDFIVSNEIKIPKGLFEEYEDIIDDWCEENEFDIYTKK